MSRVQPLPFGQASRASRRRSQGPRVYLRAEGSAAQSDGDDVTTLRRRAATEDDGGRAAPNVRLGRGTLIEDDVRLGAGAAQSGQSKGLEIGSGAIIRSGSAVHDGIRIGDRLEIGRNVVIGE